MKKKIQFPNIKKHMQNFLTDESGKISKHNALGLGLVGAILGAIDGVDAHHCDTTSFKGSGTRSTWSGPGSGVFKRGGTCQHLSNIYNTTRPAGASNAEISGGSNITKGRDLGTPPGSECNLGTSNNVRDTTRNETYYKYCGTFNSTTPGHLSRTGTFGEAQAQHVTTHTNTHSNY